MHDGHDRAVLARQTVWPPRLFSILAGFVEAGESFESCVVREIAEEVGLDVREVTYLGSQPWPFPRPLMNGFHALGAPDQPLAFGAGAPPQTSAEGPWRFYGWRLLALDPPLAAMFLAVLPLYWRRGRRTPQDCLLLAWLGVVLLSVLVTMQA